MVVFSLLGWSPFLPSGFLVSRRTLDAAKFVNLFDYRTFTSFGLPFQIVRLSFTSLRRGPYPKLIINLVWAVPISLATTFGIAICFLFLRVLRCFSSPGSPRIPMDSVYDNAILLALSSLIRISTDQRIFAPNRSFSQLVTSFFGAMYQGILRKPFVA